MDGALVNYLLYHCKVGVVSFCDLTFSLSASVSNAPCFGFAGRGTEIDVAVCEGDAELLSVVYVIAL